MYCLTERLLVSQDGLCSMELVTLLRIKFPISPTEINFKYETKFINFLHHLFVCKNPARLSSANISNVPYRDQFEHSTRSPGTIRCKMSTLPPRRTHMYSEGKKNTKIFPFFVYTPISLGVHIGDRRPFRTANSTYLAGHNTSLALSLNPSALSLSY
jgi:hypothetical protein